MKYITLEELKIMKYQHIIDDISSENNDIINEIEEMVISEISTYIGNRYDVGFIFTRIGTDRHPLIKRLVIDFTICYLMERIVGSSIPEYISLKCLKNIEFLTKVAKGTLNIPDLPKLDDVLEKGIGFMGGSETKFIDININ